MCFARATAEEAEKDIQDGSEGEPVWRGCRSDGYAN